MCKLRCRGTTCVNSGAEVPQVHEAKIALCGCMEGSGDPHTQCVLLSVLVRWSGLG